MHSRSLETIDPCLPKVKDGAGGGGGGGDVIVVFFGHRFFPLNAEVTPFGAFVQRYSDQERNGDGDGSKRPPVSSVGAQQHE